MPLLSILQSVRLSRGHVGLGMLMSLFFLLQLLLIAKDAENEERPYGKQSGISSSFTTQFSLQVPITIVTAASGNHLCALEAFLYHINRVFDHQLRWDPNNTDQQLERALALAKRIENGQIYLQTTKMEGLKPKPERKKKHRTKIGSHRKGTQTKRQRRTGKQLLSKGKSYKKVNPKVMIRKRSDQKQQRHHHHQHYHRHNARSIIPPRPNTTAHSSQIYELRPTVIVYNLGMGIRKRKQRRFRALVEAGLIDQVVDFEFEKYPPFWNLEAEGDRRGEYGWKVGILEQVSKNLHLKAGADARATFEAMTATVATDQKVDFGSQRKQRLRSKGKTGVTGSTILETSVDFTESKSSRSNPQKRTNEEAVMEEIESLYNDEVEMGSSAPKKIISKEELDQQAAAARQSLTEDHHQDLTIAMLAAASAKQQQSDGKITTVVDHDEYSPESPLKLVSVLESGDQTPSITSPPFIPVANPTPLPNADADSHPGIVLWLDSGDRIGVDFLRWLPGFLKHQEGLWSPMSQDDFGTWTHPGMVTYFQDREAVASRQAQDKEGFQASSRFPPTIPANETNCNGAAIAIDTNNQTIREGILKEWIDCAYHRECISPMGSSRDNHRQDQAALTYLVKKMMSITAFVTDPENKDEKQEGNEPKDQPMKEQFVLNRNICREYPEFYSVYTNQDRFCRADIAANPDRVITTK